MPKSRKTPRVIVPLLAALTFTLAPSAFAGDRIVAHLEESFEVAGELQAAGELTVRERNSLNPVATLYEVWVDGRSFGLLMTQDADAKHVSTRDELIFRRDLRGGHLVLEAIGLEGQPVRMLVDPGRELLALATLD